MSGLPSHSCFCEVKLSSEVIEKRAYFYWLIAGLKCKRLF